MDLTRLSQVFKISENWCEYISGGIKMTLFSQKCLIRQIFYRIENISSFYLKVSMCGIPL